MIPETQRSPLIYAYLSFAEGVGFEPTEPFRVHGLAIRCNNRSANLPDESSFALSCYTSTGSSGKSCLISSLANQIWNRLAPIS